MPKYYHKHASVSLDELKSLRIRNYNNMIVSFLNINTIRNKLDNLKPITDKTIDILCIAETKTDQAFSNSTVYFACSS